LKDPENINTKGSVKVVEFNYDDDEVDMEITCEHPGEFVPQVRKVLDN